MSALGYRVGYLTGNTSYFSGIGLSMQLDTDGRLSVVVADGPLTAAVA